MSRLLRKLVDYNNPSSLGFRLRARRIAPLVGLIEECYKLTGTVKIIDLGGTELYWKILPPDMLTKYNVHITLVNLPGSPVSSKESDRFTYIEGDACDLGDLADNSYDIAHSNSVIEHVGTWARMQDFSREVQRLARGYYIQTPNYWFPVEPHCLTPFFHWLPFPWRIRMVQLAPLGNWPKAKGLAEAVDRVQSAQLLNKPMMRSLFPDGAITMERIAFVPKSIIAFGHSSQ